MPYCSKCGAELTEDAKFCPTCGTPAGPPLAEPGEKRKERKPISVLAIVLITIIVIGGVISTIAVLAFLPLRTLEDQKRHSVPYQIGVDTLNLNFAADVAQVNIAFEENLTGFGGRLAISLDASATAKGGLLASPDISESGWFSSSDTKVGNVLTVTSVVDIVDGAWPWYSSLNVTCDIRIDSSMNTSLNVRTSTGGILLDTHSGVVLNSLDLEATTGGVEANLVEDVVVADDVFVKTTTGGVKFSWDNVNVTEDVLVNAITTTGGVDVDVKQDERLLGNVTLKGETTTGGVDFAIDIRRDVGAMIESSTSLGGIDVDRQVGFSGTEAFLQSDNYPAGSNFEVTLKTTTGGIDIDAKSTP